MNVKTVSLIKYSICSVVILILISGVVTAGSINAQVNNLKAPGSVLKDSGVAQRMWRSQSECILTNDANVFYSDGSDRVYADTISNIFCITDNGSDDADFDDPRFFDDGLEQYQLYSGGIGLGICNKRWSAQSFTPDCSKLSMVKLLITKVGFPSGKLTVKIRGSLNGPDLTSATTDTSKIPVGASKDWITFDVPDITVVPGNMYYIVLCSPESENVGGTDYVWWINTNEKSYSQGGGFGSVDNGSAWHDRNGADYGFKTYFCPPAEQTSQIQTYCSHGAPIGNIRWLAQEFIPMVATLTKIDLYISASPEVSHPLTMKIRENLTGNDLTSVSLFPTGLPIECNNVLTFDFSDVDVTPAASYYMVLCNPNASSSFDDDWYWHFNAYNDTYNGGMEHESYDGGITWYHNFWEIYEPGYDFWFKTYGYNGSHPFQADDIDGTIKGKINMVYNYSTLSADDDGDRLKYCFDWGDGTFTWTCYYGSGEMATAEHSWKEEGTFEIQVKVKDESGAQSEWSDPLPVTMPKHKLLLHWSYLRILERVVGRVPIFM